jgi:hypothetical protein
VPGVQREKDQSKKYRRTYFWNLVAKNKGVPVSDALANYEAATTLNLILAIDKAIRRRRTRGLISIPTVLSIDKDFCNPGSRNYNTGSIRTLTCQLCNLIT